MPTWFFPTLIIGVAAITLTHIFRLARRQAELSRQIRQRLGFIEIEQSDPALVERLNRILEPDGGGVKVSKVFKRDYGSYALYDCRVLEGRNDKNADLKTVIVGRGWQVPSLRLAPRMGGEGRGWKLLNSLTLLAVKQGGFEPIALETSPEFTKKYTALSRSPQDAACQVPGEVWSDLAALPGLLMIDAEGDTVIFSDCKALTERIKGDFETQETERLKQVIETASRLNGVFEHCMAGVVKEPAMS